MDNAIGNGTRDRNKEKLQEPSSMLSNDQFLGSRYMLYHCIQVKENINGRREIIDCTII